MSLTAFALAGPPLTLLDCWHNVRQHIEQCASHHRELNAAPRLLVVSKGRDATAIRALAMAGQRDFAENKVQEFTQKALELNDCSIVWHYIGRIQSNKCKAIAQHFDWVHSLSEVETAQKLNHHRSHFDRPLKCLVQVNTTTSANKSGITPAQLGGFLSATAVLPHLVICGLMTMAEKNTSAKECTQCFDALRVLQQKHQDQYPRLTELSMGMSHDYQYAIACGATWLRIGSAVFE
jgi:pyridoxal phosphate enzyme (YggS family)